MADPGPVDAKMARMLPIAFADIVRAFEDLNSAVPAAEGHGYLCGALCASANYRLQSWLEEVLPEAPSRDARQVLRQLFDDTRQVLLGESMDLFLLLPDDEAPLRLRVLALSQWCQGFLYGFGSARPAGGERLPGDVNELLRDLAQIGRAVSEPAEGDEEEESAYAEIVEYVRVGVQLIHDECAVPGGSRQ